MLKPLFTSHFEFDHWANQKFINFLSQNTIKNDKVFSVLGHVSSAQILWLKRIIELEIEGYPLWKIYSYDELSIMNEKSYNAWKEFIEDHNNDDFPEIISYKNTKGQSYDTPLNEIIHHVLYHGTYHRGQLAMLIRQEGFTPPYTDYIAFIRNQ